MAEHISMLYVPYETLTGEALAVYHLLHTYRGRLSPRLEKRRREIAQQAFEELMYKPSLLKELYEKIKV